MQLGKFYLGDNVWGKLYFFIASRFSVYNGGRKPSAQIFRCPHSADYTYSVKYKHKKNKKFRK